MQFSVMKSAVAAAILSAASVVANTVTFHNLDGIAKTIYFTCNPNSVGMAATTLRLEGNQVATWNANGAWEGNFFSVNDGEPVVPGMLGEVNFGTPGMVWFDVSAIVNPHDNLGVKEIWGAPTDPVSGCSSYATVCHNAYNAANDVQTKAATGTRDLQCSVGVGASPVKARSEEIAARAAEAVQVVRRHARDFLRSAREAIHI